MNQDRNSGNLKLRVYIFKLINKRLHKNKSSYFKVNREDNFITPDASNGMHRANKNNT